MEPRKATRIIRAAGAVVVLVSVFLTWMSGLPVVPDASLAAMALQALVVLQVASLHFIIISAVLVIVGALVAFRHSLGGIPVLAGVGLFYFEWNRQLVLLACDPSQWPGCGPGGLPDYSGVAFGFGLWVAIGGAAVILAAAIPQILPWAKKRKKLAGAILAGLIVSAAAGGVGFYFFVHVPSNLDTIPPVAVISRLYQLKPVGLEAYTPHTGTFGGYGSTDNVGIVSYEWNFGDGATLTTETAVNVTHTYAQPGDYTDYTVNLTVRDAAGNADTHSRTLRIFALHPVGSIGVSISQTTDGGGQRISGLVWQLTFAEVTGQLPTNILLKFYDPAGELLSSANLSNLFTSTRSNPNVEFVPIDPSSSTIQAGDKILALVSMFPVGTNYELISASYYFVVHAQGTLQ